jgi:predicted RNA-binding protein associated with RNAse of E/G family
MAVTIIKQDPRGNEKIRYQGKVIATFPGEVVIQATWTLPRKELGYVVFEPGDRFVEYYYAHRWFNVFDITDSSGRRKGWYCNITEPAHITSDCIEQIDLFLDVWVNPQGQTLLLDEDEFAADTTMSETQRRGAQVGLQTLFYVITARQDMFLGIGENV